ncbi:MAG TPA: hypothetical protein VKX49_02220 [Bryobacteraceae bacterium]|nr:hypothetical protein [Bryobacteraceae bacterium]
MLRCTSCNGILTKTEKVCYSCGSAIEQNAEEKTKGGGFNTVVSIVFYMSLGLTGLSMFTNFAPPLSVCIPITVVLMFVKSSADQLKKNQT